MKVHHDRPGCRTHRCAGAGRGRGGRRRTARGEAERHLSEPGWPPRFPSRRWPLEQHSMHTPASLGSIPRQFPHLWIRRAVGRLRWPRETERDQVRGRRAVLAIRVRRRPGPSHLADLPVAIKRPGSAQAVAQLGASPLPVYSSVCRSLRARAIQPLPAPPSPPALGNTRTCSSRRHTRGPAALLLSERRSGPGVPQRGDSRVRGLGAG